MPFSALALAVALIAPDVPPAGTTAAIPAIRLDKTFSSTKWKRPTQILQRPDDNDQLYVLEQGGRIRVVRESTREAEASLFMDIDDRVNFGSNEEGLLSVAFHPKFKENHEFFVYYSAEKPRRSVLSRFKAVPAPKAGDGSSDAKKVATLDLVGDPASEEVILTVDQPYWNHNGGTVLFGPDGMLYLSFGDGGAANDPHRNGQNLNTLLAKVIRIDVDHRDGEKPYSIPKDNPFVGRTDARPEIWAYGLRNVWRMSFDRKTGLLWAGDVGQNLWEEIDVVTRGGNFGWNLREGRHKFAEGGEERGATIDPIFEYDRKAGVSVTGGYVYRGAQHPALDGVYLFADYGFGTVWGARIDGTTSADARPAPTPEVLFRKGGLMISSFGETNAGELYVTAFEGSEQGPGAVYRVVVR